MDKLFLVDEKRQILKTYKDFLDDLQSIRRINKVILETSPYLIFLKLIRALISGKQIDLIDYDLSSEEIKRLGIKDEEISREIELEEIEIRNFDELIERIEQGKRYWKLGLYTSGTTGRPKKVYHNYENITRNVKTGERYQDNVWAFSYNPTHIAGIQVFFQALMNRNTIIYIFDLNREKIPELLKKYKVTNISATPTFYRTIIPALSFPIESVRRITFGGEKYDPTLENTLKQFFPNAKIVNIYASTEAGTLLSSHGEFFEIPENKEKYFKIEKDGELLIHRDLIGESQDLTLKGDWYYTGDIVEIIDKNKIKFIGRKNEMINIGGYKVNPNEVEEEIKKIDWIIDVHVYSRKNRITGNILAADVVKKEGIDDKELEKIIYERLNSNLQYWKIPRIINFVEKISLTRTGKKVRN
jgi:acyl-coenzyme A synthetase/AMP-(fatty) acid ligase